MKLSEGASTTATTTAVRDVACEMRSFFFLHPSPFLFFFPLLYFVSLPLPECFRGAASGAPTWQRQYLSRSMILPYVPFSFSRVAMCSPDDEFRKSSNRSLARSRLCRDGERANIRFSRLPAFPSPSPLFDFLVWVCFRFSFDFALSHAMFTFAWILQPSTPFPFFPISSLPFLFHSVTYPVTYKSKFWFYDNPTEIQLNLKD